MSAAIGGYRPLRDYAMIGDSRTAALVATDGSIDWYCVPHFDSPAVFCRLLDGSKGGFFRVGPPDRFSASRAYVGPTNVLATTFHTSTGQACVTDFMPVPTPHEEPQTRRILRRIEGLAGHVALALDLLPTYDYGRAEADISLIDNGAIIMAAQGHLRLACPVPVHRAPTGALTARWTVRAGERCWVILTYQAGEPSALPTSAQMAETALASTLSHWHAWSATCTYQGPYHDLVRRSALILKLLTFELTGAIVAAPTTSLPEAIGGERNWDYRYTWLRDTAWVLDGLMSIGYHGEAMAFWRWLEPLPWDHPEALRILYRIDRSPAPPEVLLAHLDGYRGSRPVRIGNGAATQTQLDVYGEVVRGLYTCSARMPEMRPLRPTLWRIITTLADEAAARWGEPDHGLWEMRSAPQHFLASKLMCWVALDRALRMAQRDQLPAPIGRWRQIRAEIRRAILEAGYDPELGAFTQILGRQALDASALLLPLVGFLDPLDPRVCSTVSRLRAHLTEDGLMCRYRTDDGLRGREATFALCTFWLVDTLALSGQLDDAQRLFERVVSYANDVGLLSEEIDPTTGDLLGNYPQGLPHLALIRSAVRLAAPQARSPGDS